MRNAIIGLWPFMLGFILLLVAIALGCGPEPSRDDHSGGSESSDSSTGDSVECEPAIWIEGGAAFTCCCNPSGDAPQCGVGGIPPVAECE